MPVCWSSTGARTAHTQQQEPLCLLQQAQKTHSLLLLGLKAVQQGRSALQLSRTRREVRLLALLLHLLSSSPALRPSQMPEQ